MSYIFDKLPGKYTLVTFSDTGEAFVSRGDTLTDEQFARLTPASQRHVRAALKAGFITNPDSQQAAEPARDAAPRKRGKE